MATKQQLKHSSNVLPTRPLNWLQWKLCRSLMLVPMNILMAKLADLRILIILSNISEVIVYNRDLKDEEITAVRAYLTKKYGFTA